MPDANQVPDSKRTSPASPDSDLTFRVAALEAEVKQLKERQPRWLGRFGGELTAVGTLLALLSSFFALQGRLLPSPHTTLEGPDLRMQYSPSSKGLTFTVGLAARNNGTSPDIFNIPEATLATAGGEELPAAHLIFADEKHQTQDPPLIINPGISKIYVSPTFSYSQSDAASDTTAKSLQISLPRETGSAVKKQLCFPLGAKDIEQASQASPSAVRVSTSDCPKVKK